MRHINYLLLSFLIIVLAIPNYCTAQMQSTLTTSTKRTISVPNVKPIKSLPLELNTDKILTLSQYENGNTSVSIFSLTDNNTTAVLSCITKERFRVGSVNTVERSGNISMSLSNIHFSATSLTSSPIQTQYYSLDCK